MSKNSDKINACVSKMIEIHCSDLTVMSFEEQLEIRGSEWCQPGINWQLVLTNWSNTG